MDTHNINKVLLYLPARFKFHNTIRLPNNLGLMTIHPLNFHEELNKFLILKANYMI